jgi:hypothetical protein
MRGIICGALMALMISVANAAVNNADYFLPYCKINPLQVQNSRPYEAHIRGECYGTIAALRNMLPLVKVLDRDKVIPFCADIPEGTIMIELVGVVVSYGNLHPELTHMDFHGFVLEAFHHEWPCKK